MERKVKTKTDILLVTSIPDSAAEVTIIFKKSNEGILSLIHSKFWLKEAQPKKENMVFIKIPKLVLSITALFIINIKKIKYYDFLHTYIIQASTFFKIL